MWLGRKLNFQRPQSQKLFYGRFINAVHLAHTSIIAEQNDLQRVLCPLLVLAQPRTDRLTFIFIFLKKKKDVSRCLGAHWKKLFRLHYWHLLFSFLYTTMISTRNKRQSTGYGSTWLEMKSLSLHHLIILLKLPTNWIWFCRQGFLAENLAHGAGKILVQ